MGGGKWSGDTYNRVTRSAINAGKSFAYSATAHATGRYEVHETLDAAWKAGDASPLAGQPVRESRDSDDHPESLPIAVFFDVTGSMHSIPRVLQEKLPKLYGLLLQKGYVEHPQILFGAIGDAYHDRAPLQIGQFESDNRADENLENFILEGGGGGGNHESYELAAYYMARHTHTDAWEKRGKKGYLFLIGDERIYDTVDRQQVARLIGDGMQENLSTRDLFGELREKWEVFYLWAEEGSYEPADVLEPSATSPGSPGALAWRDLLGQNALILEDASSVCEVIALSIGLNEGTIDLDEGLEHLREIGTESEVIESTSKALVAVGAGAGPVATTDGDLPEAEDDDGVETV